MNIAFPFHFDALGGTASCGGDDHIRQMIRMLLFTAPGERVNRPDFGCGLYDLAFEPNSPEIAAALRFTIQAALERSLGDLIEVIELEAESEESRLTVTLRYVVRRTGDEEEAKFERPLP